jgi:glyceraldehyde 3-phosphate dehydrogenase
MVYRVAINGFGRIGRNVFKVIEQGGFSDLFDVVAVNARSSPAALAHRLRFDSTYGRYDADVSSDEDGITVNGRHVTVLAERDPAKLPWRELDVDLVLEATGHFTAADQARGHLSAGARKVIITAPAQGEDITIVLGVNEMRYDAGVHDIISNASCTTNCLAPVAKVLLDRFGITQALVTTVHSYTADQVLVDGSHDDPRRARGAAENIIPTTTGAARAVGLVLPELAGKLDGFALRVPTPTVSIIDLVVLTERSATVASVNEAFRSAAGCEELRAILAYNDDELVSSDYRGDSHSAIIDGRSTMVTDDRLVKIVAWYDNEWGYSCRVADLAGFVCEHGFPGADAR